MSALLRIPVGNTPDWETKQVNDEGPLNGILESSVIYYALRQSRNAWITSVFPKFASRSKAKGQKDVTQPPHNLRFVSKCDIEIGPHIFPETSVYEAHYLPEPSHYAMGSTMGSTAIYSQSAAYPQTTTYPQVMSGTYSYPVTSYTPYVAPVEQRASTSTSTLIPTAEPSEPSLDVTPALIAQVNEAASTNPTLHNLLQIAAAGQATMDQLRTLGFFIQSLATAQQRTPPTTPSVNFSAAQASPPTSAFMQAAKYSPPHTPPKRPDLVLEFRENHTERFLIPREIVACEQEVPQSQTFRKDIVLYTFVPFLNDEAMFKAGTSATSRTPTTIRFLNVSDPIWESIRGWVNEEAKHTDAWDTFYDKAEASAPRTYLQYRLPSGDLLSQLRASCTNGYATKNIKPAAVMVTTGSKCSRSRKTALQAAKSAKSSNDADASTAQLGQVDQSAANEESVQEKEATPKRQKITAKVGSIPRARTTGSLYFINTIAPPPALPQLQPDVQPSPAPSPMPNESQQQVNQDTT